jgi:hypothetical protein
MTSNASDAEIGSTQTYTVNYTLLAATMRRAKTSASSGTVERICGHRGHKHETLGDVLKKRLPRRGFVVGAFPFHIFDSLMELQVSQ